MTDGEHIFILEEADPETFETFGYRWGKDKNHVYESGVLLEGLDPKEFEVVPGQIEEFFYYVRGNGKVFWLRDELKDVDAETFQVEQDPETQATKAWDKYGEFRSSNRIEK